MDLELAELAWQIAFWITAALTIVPFPFKIYGYLNGSDKSPILVKVDELFAVALTWIGLVAFFGFVYDKAFFTQTVWFAWLSIMLLFTVTGPFWSPKLAYAKEVLGDKTYHVVYWSSLVIYMPMFLAVFQYAQNGVT